MGEETRKANRRRVNDPLFHDVFAGKGIDIGCGDDRLDRDGLFPRITSCEGFDVADGDAQVIGRYRAGDAYDFVYSSHCLEHLSDPAMALRSWFALVRPSGFLVVVVPDEDLYEQGNWPSRFNADHKWSFTIKKHASWSPRSINFIDLIAECLTGFSFVRISLLDSHYDYAIAGIDQSSGPAETGIEVVLRKHTAAAGHWCGQVDLGRLLATGGVIGNPENLAHRLPTIRRCVELLRCGSPKVFVECGSQSTTLLHSQGMSTAIWAAVAQWSGGRLWTVDHSAEVMKRCRQLTSAYDNIVYVQQDSVEFLNAFEHGIDFLYLDSYDFFEQCKDQARTHQLAEINAAFPRLAPGAVILLDDAHVQMWFSRALDDIDIQGSTLLSHQFLLARGATCVCDLPCYQRLYVLPRDWHSADAEVIGTTAITVSGPRS